jgi:hypothetical protein
MTWFRVDDTMILNGKVGDLSDSELRSLLGLWSFCSRSKNDGEFILDDLRHAVFATPRGPRIVRAEHVSKFVSMGLVNTEDGVAFSVNDWRTYQPKDPTGAERQKRYRDRDKTVTP